MREQASLVQRRQRTLEDANLKLGSVPTQTMSKIGRALLDALVDGKADPDKLLALVHRGVKAPPQTLRAALQGRVTVRHRFLLHLRQFDASAAVIAEINAKVDRDRDPFRRAVRLLSTISGVCDLTAQVIVSEIGTSRKPLGFADMSRLPTAGHLISWAGLCSRNDEGAGKRRSTRLRKGAPWLKTTLVQCAWAGARKKAIRAVTASILTTTYHVPHDGSFYQDLGADHFRRISPIKSLNSAPPAQLCPQPKWRFLFSRPSTAPMAAPASA